MEKIKKTEEQWRAELTPEQYRVLREKGTERPFTGEYDHVFEPGTYHCVGCGAELFVSETKYGGLARSLTDFEVSRFTIASKTSLMCTMPVIASSLAM